MATADEIADAIATDAVSGVASASNSAGSVTLQSVDDRIKAAEYVAGRARNKKGKKPFRVLRMPSPGV